jgi:homoserine O-acetyltransferase
MTVADTVTEPLTQTVTEPSAQRATRFSDQQVTQQPLTTRRPARPTSRATADGPAAAPVAAPAPARPTDRRDGVWRVGDPVGRRQFAEIGNLELERGGVIPDVRIAYETWGTLNEAGDNAILIEHALTGDSHVVGEAGDGHLSPGWWNSLIGPGRPVDPAHWFVIASNVLGGCQGSTGPSSPAPDGRPWGSRFPYLTVRDQVAAERGLLDRLGVSTLAAVVGGSMGGMRAIEWAVSHPAAVRRCIVLASTAYATADQIAWCQPQLLAIRSDPDFVGGDYYDTGRRPDTGLGLARRIAHVTYRTETELGERFGREAQLGEDPLRAADRGRFAVESYLDHHAGKLARRFDANSYLVLTESMNSHDVGRDRGGVEAALASVSADCTVVSVDTDRLYPPRLSDQLHDALPRSTRERISSAFGHDGFLIEEEQVGRIVAEALARPRA